MTLIILRVVSILVALMGIAFVWSVGFFRVFSQPSGPAALERASITALVVIAVLVICIFLPHRLLPVKTGAIPTTVFLIALIIATSFFPSAVKKHLESTRMSRVEADNKRRQSDILAKLEKIATDINVRAAAKRAFTSEEAMAFVVFIKDSNLQYIGLPDYSPEALELLEKAVNMGVFDPNVTFNSPAAPLGDPLYLVFYQRTIELAEVTHVDIDPVDRKIIKVLFNNGADLSLKDHSGRVIKTYLKLEDL